MLKRDISDSFNIMQLDFERFFTILVVGFYGNIAVIFDYLL